MKHRIVKFVLLFGLNLSRAFQPKLMSSIGGARRSRRSQLSFSSGLMESSLDLSLVPSLTAFSSIFVGAAGTLLYNRIIITAEQKKLASQSSAVMIPSKQEQQEAEEELIEFQMEINQVLRDANNAIKEAEEAKEEEDENVPTALLTSLAKQNNNGQVMAMRDRSNDTITSESQVEDGNVIEEEKQEVMQDDTSILSILTSSNDLSNDTDAAVIEKEEATAEDQMKEPSFMESIQQSSDKSNVTDSEPQEESIDASPPIVAKQNEHPEPVMSIESASVDKTEATKRPTTPNSSDNAFAKHTDSPKTKFVTPKEAATSFRIQQQQQQVESDPYVVGQPRSVTAAANKEAFLPMTSPLRTPPPPPKKQETGSSNVVLPAAVATAAKTTPPPVKKKSLYTRPQSTSEIMKNIPTMPTMTRSSNGGVASTPPRRTTTIDMTPQRRQPIHQQEPVKSTAVVDDTSAPTKDVVVEDDDASLKTSLSMLSRKEPPSPGMEESFAEAMDSLHRHIQNQARDMTRKRMDNKINSSTSDSDLPGFMTPETMRESVVAVATRPSVVLQVEEEQQVAMTAALSPPSSSDEQVARMLKKKSRPSLVKRVRNSVVVVGLTTGIVVVGKRVAALVIGGGLL